MSVAFREIHRAQHRRRLRESTDLELIIAGRMLRDLVASAKTIVSVDGDRGEKFQVQLDDAIEEWRAPGNPHGAPATCACATCQAPSRSLGMRGRGGPPVTIVGWSGGWGCEQVTLICCSAGGRRWS